MDTETESFLSPWSLVVVVVLIIYLVRRYLTQPAPPMMPTATSNDEKPIPRMEPRDHTVESLREFDGSDETKPIGLAINGKVFDVTKSRDFYGPDGPYAVFGGRDATRAFANFVADESEMRDGYDPCDDLTHVQRMRVQDWEDHFMTKYDYIGRLLSPDEAGAGGRGSEALRRRVDELVQEAEKIAEEDVNNSSFSALRDLINSDDDSSKKTN